MVDGRKTSVALRDLRLRARPLELEWFGFVVGLALITFAANRGALGGVVWESNLALFIIVVIAATLCVVAAALVFAIAWRDNNAEGCTLGTGLLVMSILPLVHGLTAPGVLYGENTAVMASAYVALPIAVAAMSPLLVPGHAIRRMIGKRWRPWCAGWVVIATLAAIAFLVWPDVLAVPPRASVMNIAVVVVCTLALAALSHQQLRLYWISERPSTLVASFSMAFLGLTALAWTGDRPFNLGWWFVHVLDIVGVFAGCFALAVSHRSHTSVRELLAPVATRDPLTALELGLSPTVHRFVRSLETKDRITRDHVVRVAEAAIAVGVAMGLNERQLRFLGIGALLHDIGKLNVPDEILNKPGALTDHEYDIMKRHPIDGEAMLRAVPSLADAAMFVRSHHERVDGRGYPDAKSGEEITLEARIIATCDSFDAMRHSRQYRVGMSWDRATEIMREHAGTQWDRDVVETTLRVMFGRTDEGLALERVGRPRVDSEIAALVTRRLGGGDDGSDDGGHHRGMDACAERGTELNQAGCGCDDALPSLAGAGFPAGS